METMVVINAANFEINRHLIGTIIASSLVVFDAQVWSGMVKRLQFTTPDQSPKTMSLTQYKQKRSFGQTPEPKGGKAGQDALVFVIQKHDATRLHYDFRLEMGGVLKSWAVPKGPSTDPSVRRLAMMVEDHPFDYKDFEGIIPKGNYGAGTVMVWDFGTYEPLEEVDGKLQEVTGKKAQEKLLRKELRSGSLKLRLNGKKLKGEYALVKTKGMEENAWLLIKHRDRYASEKDITEKDRSAVSLRTLRGIEKDGDAVWESKSGAQGPAEDRTAEKKKVRTLTQRPF